MHCLDCASVQGVDSSGDMLICGRFRIRPIEFVALSAVFDFVRKNIVEKCVQSAWIVSALLWFVSGCVDSVEETIDPVLSPIELLSNSPCPANGRSVFRLEKGSGSRLLAPYT